MSDNLELYELFPHFKICFSQIKSEVIKCSIRKTCKCWSLNYGTIIEKGWKFNHVDAFQLERRFKLHSSVTSDLTRKKKKSPWFSLWQHRLITCELLILPPLEEIFSHPKWELWYSKQIEIPSQQICDLLSLSIKPEETWLQYMWWEHIQKPFTWFTHNQQTLQKSDRFISREPPTIICTLIECSLRPSAQLLPRPLYCTDPMLLSSLDEGRQQHETISNITEEKRRETNQTSPQTDSLRWVTLRPQQQF